MGAVFSSEDRAGHSNRSRVCIVCSQKPTYARYTRTQLRKRLHTMHTKTRIGVSVGLRVRKCMHTEMHTERIRNAYKHIKREKERILLLLSLYIVCLYIFYCSRFQAIILNCSRFQACTDPIEPSETSIKPHCLFFSDRGRCHVFRVCMHCMQSKTNLCTLYKNTTPEKTAYNAYKKRVWLESRAEGTKMYAYGNAYRLHTKCIQAYRKSKREKFFLLLPFYIVCLPSLPASSDNRLRLFALSGIHGPRQASLPVLSGQGQPAKKKAPHP